MDILDPLLLLYTQFKKIVPQQIDLFLYINDCPDIPQRTLANTSTHIRGQIISYTARMNKQRNKCLLEIKQTKMDLDKKYSSSPTSELHKESPFCKWIRQRRIYVEQNKAKVIPTNIHEDQTCFISGRQVY